MVRRLLLAVCVSGAVFGDGVATPAGSFTASLRYRFDLFERGETAYPYTAEASTLRLSLVFESKSWHGFSGAAELQGAYLAGPGDYTLPTVPSQVRPGYPSVSDPANVTAFSQAYLRYIKGGNEAGVSVEAGRIEIVLNDSRFLSNSIWRQFHQSFDGARITTRLPGQWNASYAYLARAHRVVGPDATDGAPRMATHVIATGWHSSGRAEINAYGLLVDNREPLKIWNAPSTATFGIRVAGPYNLKNPAWSILYAAEYARQKNYASYTPMVNAPYFLGELGSRWRGLSVKAGYASLGGRSTTDKLSTPLSPPMNGWTELFGSNPSIGTSHGLEARYITSSVSATRTLSMTGTFYDYHSAFHRIHYGKEADAMILWRPPRAKNHLELGWRLGYYLADRLYGNGLRSCLFSTLRL